ncbi:MAG: hypothetical protein WCK10_00025 [Candidatus Staskawiczbacteria bacterium]
MNTQINKKNKIGIITLSIISMALIMFLLPIQSASAACSSCPTCPSAVAVSCSANPSSIHIGEPATFTATAAGGSILYSWSGACTGSAASCTNTFNSTGIKNAIVTARSTCGTSTSIATTTCSVNVIDATPTLAVSCSANPSSIQTGNSSTFNSTVSGGTGSYTYNWSGACTGTSSNCTNTINGSGTQTATITVVSGTQTASANCSLIVIQPNLTISCSANPSSIQTGNSSTFNSTVSGGTGSYTYNWSGACTGSAAGCTNTFNTAGTQTATLNVTSGTQTQTTYCSINITTSCTPNYQQRCIGTSQYWYDSCGNQGNYIGTCGNTCTLNYQQRCIGTSQYWYDSCGNQGNYIGTCGNTCTLNYQQRCIGTSQYWYDSCGNQGSYIGTCGVTNAAITISKTVRNLTNSAGFSTSTYASPLNMLMFMITVQNTSNQNANNVVVRDALPSNLIYNNQLVVARSNNANNNYSGDLSYGINLNTLSAGQTVTITYQAQVASATNFSFGTTTLNNSAYITSSNSNGGNATASVVVTKAGVLGASTISTGLTNNFWVDSFFLPLLLTLIGIWMWKSGMFFGIEKWLNSKKKTIRGYKAEKELSDRIAKIQKFGNK